MRRYVMERGKRCRKFDIELFPLESETLGGRMNSTTILNEFIKIVQSSHIKIDPGTCKDDAYIIAATYALVLRSDVTFDFNGAKRKIIFNRLLIAVIGRDGL